MTRSTTSSRLMTCLCTTVLAIVPALAQQPSQQLSRDIEAALLEQGDRGTLGVSDTPLTVSAPAQVRYELGAVVAPGNAGATIMAITPGSAAKRLDLQPGDRLVAINGVQIATTDQPMAALEDALRKGGGRLHIQAVRDGRAFEVDGQADVVAIPAYQLTVGMTATEGCGFVTDQGGGIPTSQGIYRARITRIDGRSTPLDPQNRHRVDTGRHLLRIKELIPYNWLSRAKIHQIERMKRLKDDDAYKTLVVTVEANTSYRIGARLLRDKLDPDNIRNNAYWEPVIWKQVAQGCD